ncbi:Ig-like domain repeat protein, partial [Kitasatospora sp. NPDC001132]
MGAIVIHTLEPARPVARERVTLTAQVRSTDVKVGQVAQVPTGTVHFLLDQTLLAAVPLDSSGSASHETELPAGDHTVSTVYSGNEGTATHEVPVTVDQATAAPTTTTLTSSPNPSVCGEPVTFTAQVSSAQVGSQQLPPLASPTGTVTFVVSADGPSLTAALDPTTGQAQVVENGLSIGTHQAIASYSGDTNYAPSSSNLVNQSVTLAPTSTTLTVNPTPSVCGQTVTVCATVTALPPGSGIPTGTVTFTGSGGLNETVTLDATGTACFTTNSLESGPVSAQYNGDTCFDTSFLSTVVEVDQAASTTDVSITPNPSVCGQPVTVCATVTAVAPSSGTPTGTVTFTGSGGLNETVTLDATGKACFTSSSLSTGPVSAQYNGDTCFTGSSGAGKVVVNQAASSLALSVNPAPSVCGQAVTVCATVTAVPPGTGIPTGTVTFFGPPAFEQTVPLDATGTACFTTNTLQSGTVTAVYNGDACFLPVKSATPVTVNKATPKIQLTATPNPSVCGQTVTVCATVTPTAPSTATPTGKVTFREPGGLNQTATLDATGKACITTSTLQTGTVTATYSGSGCFTTGSAGIPVTVNQASTTTAVTVSPSPSVCGQLVTVCAQVAAVPPGAGTPTGTVTFSYGSTSTTVNVDATGKACLAAAFHASTTVAATYNGDSCFTSSSGSGTVTVNKASSATALLVSPVPSVCGQPVTVCATVTALAPGSGTPTGTVTFTGPGGLNQTATLDSTGKVCITTSTLQTGTVTATYSGNDCFTTSTATTTATVNQASSTVALTATPNPSVCGQPVTVCAQVTALAPSTAVPGGTVTFTGPGGLNQTATLDSTGKACITTSTLQTGTVTATYSGNTCFTASTATLAVTVNQASSTVALTATPNPSVCGQPVTVCAQVTAL